MVKEIKKVLPKDGIFQISETNSLWVLANVFLFEILNNFYIYNVDYLNSE